jgi:hypothetical protein
MRQEANEFGDLHITANRWSRQVPTYLREQWEYIRIFRSALEDTAIFQSLFANKSTRKITVDSYTADQLREFLLRPFIHAARCIPQNRREDGEKTRGYILVCREMAEYGFLYQGTSRYDFSKRDSTPVVVEAAQRLNEFDPDLWRFALQEYPVQAAAALAAIASMPPPRVDHPPPQAPPGNQLFYFT